jgi:hypothetical protein
LGTYHVPSDVETLVNTNPASLLVMVTFAPATTEPVESVTAPIMVAVPVEDWANRPVANTTHAKQMRKYKLDRLYLNGYIGKLATGPGLVMFMRGQLEKPVPSPVVLGQISEFKGNDVH